MSRDSVQTAPLVARRELVPQGECVTVRADVDDIIRIVVEVDGAEHTLTLALTRETIENAAASESHLHRDNTFMEKVTAIIRDNFGNPAFDMNRLAQEMCMGRTAFYAKVKEISGMTPGEYTLTTKLRDSIELLRDHLHLNISEIADRLGFHSAKYYSKCFKALYGVPPARWRKENCVHRAYTT